MKLLTPDDVAEIAQLHPETVRRLMREGKIPGKRMGGSWRISVRKFEEWLEADEPITLEQPSNSGRRSRATAGGKW